jgi:hypothetical protein
VRAALAIAGLQREREARRNGSLAQKSQRTALGRAHRI